MSNFKKEFNKETEKGRGRVAKEVFGFTFDEVRDKKSLVLQEKREGDNNLPKVYNL